MKQILHVRSSSNLKSAVSRAAGDDIITILKAKNPGVEVVERDVVKNPLSHLTPDMIDVFYTDGAPAMKFADALTDELLAADTIVIESPMYNFTIPSSLKAWIDHVVRAGKTFKYVDGKPVGLATGKKAILVLGRGGSYNGTPAKAMDYQETYLRFILGYMGINDVEVVDLNGMSKGAERRAEALQQAHAQIADMNEAA
jgi:FMN-dependent NADH-azoreductase